ncbi:MAG: hypothetical protein KAS32_23495 [Candidatus Peribacteraceae bacterium]|nr:hypothetical protein [Candidatus Peribacteraceae bacterium]
MDRRRFLKMMGIGIGSAIVPVSVVSAALTPSPKQDWEFIIPSKGKWKGDAISYTGNGTTQVIPTGDCIFNGDVVWIKNTERCNGAYTIVDTVRSKTDVPSMIRGI